MNHWTDPLRGVASEVLIAEGQPYATFTDWWEGSNRSDSMLWILDMARPLSQKAAQLLGCRFIRETKTSDGRLAWDMLSDEARKAVLLVQDNPKKKLTKELGFALRDVWLLSWETIHAQHADIIREMIPIEDVKQLLKLETLRLLMLFLHKEEQ